MANNLFGNLMTPENMGLLGAAGGLLSAGGPSPTPTSFGQAMGKGLLGGTIGYQQANQAQMSELQQKMMLAKLQREMKQQEALMALYGTQGAAQGSPAPSGPTEPGMSPNTSVAMFGTPDFATLPTQTPPAPPRRGPTLEQLGALASTGMKIDDHIKLWELNNPNLKYEGGVPLDPRTGQPIQGAPTMPQTNQQGFSTTTRYNPQTRSFEVGLTPGGTDAYRAQQEIGERARAGYRPFMGVTDAQGRPLPMTEAGFADTYGAGASGGGDSISQRGSQADVFGNAATDADALAQVRKAAQQGKTATFVVDPAQSGGMGPTPAVRQATVTAAEGDARKVLDLEAKIPNLLSVNRRLDRMAALTGDDQTYAAAGAELKTTLGSIAQAFGLNVNQSKTANTEEYLAHVAELLKDRLASKDFGSGAGVSNLDIIAAQKPLPELAKTSQGRLQLINALKADTQRNLTDAQSARDYFDANQGLRGFRFPSELEAEKQQRISNLPKTPGTPPGAPKVLKYDPATRSFK